MYCKHCGGALLKNARFCGSCGAQLGSDPDDRPNEGGGRIGYSERIQDPAFARYLKSINRWSIIFSSVLPIAVVVGFYIYGEAGSEIENPQSLYIGLGVGGMILVIALFTIIARKRSKTWDGVVIDKTVKQKMDTSYRNTDSGRYGSRPRFYTEYSVLIRDEHGKTHRITVRNDDTWYNYFEMGDRVRHHAGLNSYEKYDKSRDSVIFCVACQKLCDINGDLCPRCKCPLLK